MPSIQLTVANTIGSIRLDKYVSFMCADLTRSRLKNGVSEILVNGKPSKLARNIQNGDTISVTWEDPVPEHIESENIPLDIIYEDDQVTLVQKPQGMVTHPAAGNWTGTLVHALLYHWNHLSGTVPIDPVDLEAELALQPMRPGIVHRLDKDTSGLLITARTPFAEQALQTAFRMRRVKKVYIAILCGIPKERSGTIKTNLCRDPKKRQRFTWTDNPNKGKFSHTVYHITHIYGNYSLAVLRLKTGRTHQLRVHMKYLGCPILGDPIYGKKDALFPEATLMLHAKQLGLQLPGNNVFKEFETPVPLRFKKIIAKLRSLYEPNHKGNRQH